MRFFCGLHYCCFITWHLWIHVICLATPFRVAALAPRQLAILWLSHCGWNNPEGNGYIRRWVLKIMVTSSNGNIFRVTGPLCWEFTGPCEFPTQRPVTRSFDVFFDLRLNKRLSEQPWGWWVETPSWSLWRQCNDEQNLCKQGVYSESDKASYHSMCNRENPGLRLRMFRSIWNLTDVATSLPTRRLCSISRRRGFTRHHGQIFTAY